MNLVKKKAIKLMVLKMKMLSNNLFKIKMRKNKSYWKIAAKSKILERKTLSVKVVSRVWKVAVVVRLVRTIVIRMRKQY